MASTRELTTREKFYKDQEELNKYWEIKLKEVILFEKSKRFNKSKVQEEAEICKMITIDSFPKSCHKFILNKKKITWSTPLNVSYYYKEDTNIS